MEASTLFVVGSYRKVRTGALLVVYGGPMYYLAKGFKEKGFVKIGKILAVIFALLCIGASFGGGNAAQSNQAAMQLVNSFVFMRTNAVLNSTTSARGALAVCL